jgi:class 3 adenylate cyclase
LRAEGWDEAAALAALGRTIASIARSRFDLDEVLQTVIEEAARLCDADSGDIAVREGDTYRMRAFTGFSPEFEALARDLRFSPDRESVVGRTLLEGRVVHIEDVHADPELSRGTVQDAVRHAGAIRTDLGVPIRFEGEIIGVIAAARNQVRPFSASELDLVQHFADQAAVAISLARLLGTIERQRTELARYAPQAAELLSSAEGEGLLAGHRREITALFADMRGFTSFAEKADPEEVLGVLREYHSTVGELAVANGGTVEHFAGDGLMVFFNDPAPIANHQFAAVANACAMRDRFATLSAAWRKRGYELGLGIGIATGYATIGRIGFEGRYDYGAVGTSVILASRLSSAAKAGQILISQRVMAAVENQVEADIVPSLDLKGFSSATTAYAVRSCLGGPSA